MSELLKIRIADLRHRASFAGFRPPNYVDQVLAVAERHDEEFYWITPEAHASLRAKFAAAPISKVSTIAHGAAGLAKAALKIDRADDATIAFRRQACDACPLGGAGQGQAIRCRHSNCGCFIAAKIRIKSERCPATPPRW